MTVIVSFEPAIRRHGGDVQALDDKDEALILALERDARASVVALAREIGLSRSATQERLGRLQRGGAITGYTVVRGRVDGRARLNACLMIRHTRGGTCARSVVPLKRIPEVRGIQSLAGDPDLLVQVSAADAADLDRIAEAVRAMPGIGEVTTHVVLADHLHRP
jgi:DNA-binding Lrp family transcriptional regulator